MKIKKSDYASEKIQFVATYRKLHSGGYRLVSLKGGTTHPELVKRLESTSD
jgi:hypothetical protein